MKKIRMLRDVLGAHLGDPEGSRAGDVLEVDDGVAEAYVLHHLADLVAEKKSSPPPKEVEKVETAVVPPVEETAALTTEDVETPVKRRPGRPRKTT